LLSESNEFAHSFEVKVADVEPDPAQPRRVFDETALTALGQTLREQGQLQPILVRRNPAKSHGWIIIAGERRWRAARLIGWPKLLAIAYEGDPEVAMLLENLQRVDLSPVEQASGIRRLMTEKGWTQDHAARALGMSKADVSGTLAILKLPVDVLTAVLTSEHPPAKNVLVELSRVEDENALWRLAGLAKSGALTVKAVREARVPSPAPAPHPTLPAPIRTRPTGWAIIGRAVALVGRMSASGMRFSTQEADELKRLRDTIDSMLAAQRP
jgi:ParB family chromosome partitioning protein